MCCPQIQEPTPTGSTLPRRDFVLLTGRAVGVIIGTILLAACGATSVTPIPKPASVVAATHPISPTPTMDSSTAQVGPATRLPASAPAGKTATAPMMYPGGASPIVTSVRATPTFVAQPKQGTVEVQIVDFAFVPLTLVVPVGTTVRWTNTGVEHTTTSRDNVWGSEVLERGEIFSFLFTQPGTYPYICGLHPDMRAVVIVQ